LRRRWPALAATIVLGLLGAACSSGDSSATTVAASAPASVPGDDAPPRVDLIMPAVAALEAQLGEPQQYFEINATSHLVNLFVSLNGGTLAQNWLYLDGQLTSKPAEPAQGHSFAASALTFDPETVLAQVERDLAGATIDLFYVQGGADGSVRYTAVVTSAKGGQLEVVVGPDGKVQEVDADTDTVPTTAAG
jgi:hypothetical protein